TTARAGVRRPRVDAEVARARAPRWPAPPPAWLLFLPRSAGRDTPQTSRVDSTGRGLQAARSTLGRAPPRLDRIAMDPKAVTTARRYARSCGPSRVHFGPRAP